MKEINLHGCTTEDAIQSFISYYNQHVKSKQKKEFRVIHGYGSSGEGGKIRSKLRNFLECFHEEIGFRTGESLDNNPGYTLIYPRKELPSLENMLGLEILKFCEIPKTKKKIANNFRKYGDSKLLSTLKQLEKSKQIVVKWKGKHKCFVASK